MQKKSESNLQIFKAFKCNKNQKASQDLQFSSIQQVLDPRTIEKLKFPSLHRHKKRRAETSSQPTYKE